MLAGDTRTVARARTLRAQMTLPEVALWQALRQRPAGHKFRRQHPSGPYVADFYCHDLRLIIEVDGEAHDMGDRPERDARRDAHFADRGLNVLRFPAKVVLADIEAVVATIVSQSPAATPLRPFGPPPLPGED